MSVNAQQKKALIKKSTPYVAEIFSGIKDFTPEFIGNLTEAALYSATSLTGKKPTKLQGEKIEDILNVLNKKEFESRKVLGFAAAMVKAVAQDTYSSLPNGQTINFYSDSLKTKIEGYVNNMSIAKKHRDSLANKTESNYVLNASSIYSNLSKFSINPKSRPTLNY